MKELGDIKGTQIRMSEQLANLVETKKDHHEQIMKLLNEHHAELYGPPEPGLKISVDRLVQWRGAIVGTWIVLAPVAIKVFYDWVHH